MAGPQPIASRRVSQPEPERPPDARERSSADTEGGRPGAGGELLHGHVLGVPASRCCDRTRGETFNVKLLLYLVRKPIWLAGVGSMILGFVFQYAALHFGSLALVQPILATELLFVFAYMAIIGSRRVLRSDWMAGAAMAVGLGLFLFTAAPSGGARSRKRDFWWLAGSAALGLAGLATVAAFARCAEGSPPVGRAACRHLGVATGISWGFVAAVIKEMSSHSSGGLPGSSRRGPLTCSSWSGPTSMLLSAHAPGGAAGRVPARLHHRGPAGREPARCVHLLRASSARRRRRRASSSSRSAALFWGVVTLSRSRLVQGPTHDGDAATVPVGVEAVVADHAAPFSAG